MPFYRALVIGRDTASPYASDVITNTLYFDDNRLSPVGDDTDPQGLASDLANLYVGQTKFMRGLNQIEVRIYNLEDPEPRRIRGQSIKTLAGGLGSGPRDVALCLSFRGERNLPRMRGRIYLGPLTGSDVGGARPGQALRDAAIAMADGFANLGGTDVEWCVYSPTTRSTGGSLDNSFHPVKMAWVDDEFDTQRSRGLKATTRSQKAYDE